METETLKSNLPAAGQALPNERRASVRYLRDLEMTCRPAARAEIDSWSARAVDISTRGLVLILGRRFEKGTVLSVYLESANGENARTVILRVVHAAKQKGGTWRLGCSFAKEMSEAVNLR